MSSLATTWGSTASERALAFPCDSVLPNASFALYRAVTVEAPASVIFRWLCQLRVAPYSYDLLGARIRRTLLAWGDLFMMRKQLLTLKALAEKTAM